MHVIDLIRLRDKHIVCSAERHELTVIITDTIYPDKSYAFDCATYAEAIDAMHTFHYEFESIVAERPDDFTTRCLTCSPA